MAAKQAYSVKKLPPYTITETVFKAKKDAATGKHLGFEREEKARKVLDGRMIMFISGHSVRIEGGDEAVARLMGKNDPLVAAEQTRKTTLTPEQAVERVLAKANPVVQEAE